MKKQENGLGQRESSNVQTTKRKRFGNNNNKTETILWNSRRLSWIFQKSFSFAARRRLLKNSKWSLHSFFLTTRTFFFVHKVQEIEICRLRNLSPTCGHARKVLLGLRIKKNFFLSFCWRTKCAERFTLIAESSFSFSNVLPEASTKHILASSIQLHSLWFIAIWHRRRRSLKKNCSFSISLFFVNSTVVSNHETGQSCDFCTTRQRRKISGEKKEAERKSERRNAGVSATPLGRQSNESKGKTVTRADAALLYHLLSISRNTNHHHHHTRRNTERVFLHFNSKPKYIMTYTGNTKDTTFIFFFLFGDEKFQLVSSFDVEMDARWHLYGTPVIAGIHLRVVVSAKRIKELPSGTSGGNLLLYIKDS